jgi:hypothetical protein
MLLSAVPSIVLNAPVDLLFGIWLVVFIGLSEEENYDYLFIVEIFETYNYYVAGLIEINPKLFS